MRSAPSTLPRACKLVFPALASLALTGCQASVEGWWQGAIGETPCTLRLEQTGTSVEGDICSAQACEHVHGDVDESRAELGFGCAGCNFPRTRLEVEIGDTTLEGEAYLVDCPCDPSDEACVCRAHAYFTSCDEAC
ncbi:MAG TPA: hypothetical protein VL400_08850 [Polyangiaceae bacterium]|nr:hypothetical protein [Polyangiaceae bacterium]